MADPARFGSGTQVPRSIALMLLGWVLLASVLAAVPRDLPTVANVLAFGVAWLSLVLAMTLPSPSERAGAELERRLAQFRHALNAIGDAPARADLERLLELATHLDLREEEITGELEQIRAALDGLTLREQIHSGYLPLVSGIEPLPPGDCAHFSAPVRFGRRRADQVGHLVLTSGWLKFRGPADVSVAWGEVGQVQRAGRDIVIALADSRRTLRFCCATILEAVHASVIAEHLADVARRGDAGGATSVYATL